MSTEITIKDGGELLPGSGPAIPKGVAARVVGASLLAATAMLGGAACSQANGTLETKPATATSEATPECLLHILSGFAIIPINKDGVEVLDLAVVIVSSPSSVYYSLMQHEFVTPTQIELNRAQFVDKVEVMVNDIRTILEISPDNTSVTSTTESEKGGYFASFKTCVDGGAKILDNPPYRGQQT